MNVQLKGIDGSDPLGFFASLGVLRVLDEHLGNERSPRLSWQNQGSWVPTIQGVEDKDTIIETVIADLQSWKKERSITFAYTKDGGEEVSPEDEGAVRDLKPPPQIQKLLFATAANCSANVHTRTARTLTSFGTDVALDNKGMIKPSALHFTAGQQHFLKIVNELRDALKPEHIEEALIGPWQRASKLPSLSWTGMGQRMYALRASNPSKDKRGSTPGAEWLAFLGLSFFPCVPVAGSKGPRVLTTCVRGGWKTGHFTWPLWRPNLSVKTVESLLRLAKLDSDSDGNLSKFSYKEREARGIDIIFRSRILRTDPGGYGSFTPPEVV
ncbi:MAG: hypothetical protein KTR25_17055 [Myxococcales bacterium]|nr:hypothetical protein [Myxococcales bacterium]